MKFAQMKLQEQFDAVNMSRANLHASDSIHKVEKGALKQESFKHLSSNEVEL